MNDIPVFLLIGMMTGTGVSAEQDRARKPAARLDITAFVQRLDALLTAADIPGSSVAVEDIWWDNPLDRAAVERSRFAQAFLRAFVEP